MLLLVGGVFVSLLFDVLLWMCVFGVLLLLLLYGVLGLY